MTDIVMKGRKSYLNKVTQVLFAIFKSNFFCGIILSSFT